MAEEAAAATPAPGTAPESVREITRDERQSVDFAAHRIAGLIGADEPTETPGDEPETPSHEAADEGSTDEGETPEAEPSDGESADEDAEAQPELPSTLDDLIAAFEASPEWANGIKVSVKVDGEAQEVTLAEALNGYSRTQDYTRKTTELSEQRQSFEQAVSEAEAELRSRAERLSTLTTNLENQLRGSEPDWDKLLRENPQGYLQAQREWAQKTEALKGAQAERDRLVQQQQAQAQQQMQKHLAAEHEKMVKNWPELSDPKGAMATELRGYLVERGFSQQEIGALADHRMIGVLMDALKAQKVTKADPEKKLVKPKPGRTVKPGSPRNGEDAKAEKVAAARRNHRRNPKSMDAAAERIARILG